MKRQALGEECKFATFYCKLENTELTFNLNLQCLHFTLQRFHFLVCQKAINYQTIISITLTLFQMNRKELLNSFQNSKLSVTAHGHTKTDAMFSSQIKQVMTESQKSVEFNILTSALVFRSIETMRGIMYQAVFSLTTRNCNMIWQIL